MSLPVSVHLAQAVVECRKLALRTNDDMLRARIQTYAEMVQLMVPRIEVLEREIGK